MTTTKKNEIESERKHSDSLGCVALQQGFRFSVWAPHAESVSVTGDFNAWNAGVDICVRNELGIWSVDVELALPGQGYKFAIGFSGELVERIDPRAREVTNSVGYSIIVKDDFDSQHDAFTMPAWNTLVIYEMHIGTFNAKDGTPGTFETAIERLGFLKELGVNAVELMPVAEFAGDYSWGYNPAHPYAVETAYGGVEGLKKFTLEAHKLGIAVIIDVVYNHFGPSDLDIWRFDGWSENDKGGIYFYNDWRSTTPWGDTRPDYGREEVRQYIFDNAMMWLQDYHADGLRYDMTLYIRAATHDENDVLEDGYNLLQWINYEISQRFPGKITIAEDLQNNDRLTEKSEYGGGNFDAQWDAGFVHPVREALIVANDSNRSMDAIRNAIIHKYNHDVFERVIYTESHDEVANGKQRVVSEIDQSEDPNRYAVKRSSLGVCLVMTSPGIPMLFQGQEFLEDCWFQDTDPLDWQRADRYAHIIQMYRDLIRLRRNVDGLTSGLTGQFVNVYHVNDQDKIVAFHRSKEGGPGDDVVVVIKMSEDRTEKYQIGFPYSGLWKLVFNSDADCYGEHQDGTQATDLISLDEPYNGFPASALIVIGAYSCLIYSRQ
ncbi:MAG: alpha-amylase family glycosyl hydrolase [Planctomycetota bacterium]|nr:alpha-amylase family glycosyl hydrolase [Planctomycetota bacterium]